MRGDFNRSSGGRGTRTPRGSFQRAVGSEISMTQQSKIMRAGDIVRAKVDRHHAAHQEAWTNKRYSEKLTGSGGGQRPAPLGLSNDPKVVMMSQARAEVASKRTQRLARVERAVSNMRASGNIRSTRRIDWSKGLGE